MANPEARAVCQSVEALSRSHAHAPAGDVLSLVMQGRRGQVLNFAESSAEHGSLASPRSAFGQVVARAFDSAMTPDEWMLYTSPRAHPKLREAMFIIWQEEVVSKFCQAYGVTIEGLPSQS